MRRKLLAFTLMGEPKQSCEHHLSILPSKGVFPNFPGFSLPTPCHSYWHQKQMKSLKSLMMFWTGRLACQGVLLCRCLSSQAASALLSKVPVSTCSRGAAMSGFCTLLPAQKYWLRGPERAEIQLHPAGWAVYPGAVSTQRGYLFLSCTEAQFSLVIGFVFELSLLRWTILIV